MDLIKAKVKRNFITKTWKRCKTIPGGGERSFSKSQSWHGGDERRRGKRQVAPEGCFAVYVGAERQKFAIKTEYANHPLFEMLLEDAELEYGYNSEGPILLACDVDLFYKVLAEMEMEMGGQEVVGRGGCGFGSRSPFSRGQWRLGKSDMGKGCGSYGMLTPSRLIKMN